MERGVGWLHITADVALWLAFLAIPAVLFYFASRRPFVPYRWLLLLFAALMVACGTVHLIEAASFWWPAYRLSGLVKLATAVIAWATVMALVPAVPYALSLARRKSSSASSPNGGPWSAPYAKASAIPRAVRECQRHRLFARPAWAIHGR